MSRILLLDDSPHAQRIGERILTDEGYEVVTVSNADSALIRLEDVDPDVVIADTVMPGRTGFEICQYLKMSPRHRHVRVILTASVTETLDPEAARRVEADGVLQKPFEASVLASVVKPMAEAAQKDRAAREMPEEAGKPAPAAPAAPFVAVIDAEQVRAAVTVALDAAMASLVEEISLRVVTALSEVKPGEFKPETAPAQAPPPDTAFVPPPAPFKALPAPEAAAPEAATPESAPPSASSLPIAAPQAVKPTDAPVRRIEPVRRVSTVRWRSSSILGLDVGPSEPESPEPHE